MALEQLPQGAAEQLLRAARQCLDFIGRELLLDQDLHHRREKDSSGILTAGPGPASG
jgi:hypothetical protein